MSIMPRRLLRHPPIRVWVAERWGQPWQLAAPPFGVWRGAAPMGRYAFPRVGQTVLEFVFGRISGRDVDFSDAPDLLRREVVIEADAAVDAASDPAWQVVWWGRAVYREQQWDGGAADEQGVVRYHLEDGVARLFQRPLTAWQFYWNGQGYAASVGHPGYNAGDPAGQPLGDRESTLADPGSLGYVAHAWPGAGDSWTDRQVIEHALLSSTPTNEPDFLQDDDTLLTASDGKDSADLLAGVTAWPVRDGDTVGDLLARLADRRRGLGMLALWWEPGSNIEDDTWQPLLRWTPQLHDDLSYTPPVAGGTVVLPGAVSAGTAVDWDLDDDHYQRERLTLSQRATQRVGYLESVGDPLQVTVSLSGRDGSLSHRTDASEVTAFLAASAAARLQARWLPVYQQYGLPRAWNFRCGRGDGVTSDPGTGLSLTTRCDYRCDDSGALVRPWSTADLDTSPSSIRILPDTDLLEGYDYYTDTTPTRHDAGTALETAARRGVTLYQSHWDDSVSPAVSRGLTPLDDQVQLRVDPAHVWIERPGDSEAGVRWVGDTSESALASYLDWEDVTVVATLELPHRLRMASGDATSLDRRRIEHPGLALHLVHEGCVVDLEDAIDSGDTGYDPRYPAGAAPAYDGGATQSSPNILRDDRDELMRRHQLAVAWYQATHQPLTLRRAGCGLFQFEGIADTGSAKGAVTNRPHLRIGQVLHDIAHNGRTTTADTPITAIEWDPTTNITTIETDWQELDFA